MVTTSRTNISALLAQRDISIYTERGASSVAKISSGSRIVRPKDDAASLGIANQMKNNIAAMEQGIRNTLQGASLLQVAAGGLDQTVSILTRMKQLSVQVINDTLGVQEVAYANEEFSQLIGHIDSAAKSTRFNGNSLLTGGAGSTTVRNLSKTIDGGVFSDNANVNVGFEVTGEFNEEASSGFIYHDFSDNISDVIVYHDDNNIYLEVGDETFSGATSLTLGSVYVLTSLDNPNNRIALNTSGANLANATTVSGVKDALRDTFVGANLRIGSSQSRVDTAVIPAAAGAEDIFNLNDLINGDLTSGLVQGAIQSVTGEGDNGNISVELDISGETFRADGANIERGGTLTFVSTRNNGNRLTFNIQPDAAEFDLTKANGNDIRDIIQAALQNTNVEFNVGDSATATTFGGEDLGLINPFGITAVLPLVPPTFDVFNEEFSNGFIDGSVQSLDVKEIKGNYDITLMVGEQTFKAVGYKPTAADHRLDFVSVVDPESVISINVTAQAEALLETEDQWTQGLETLFGLASDTNTAPVRFQSTNAENHLKNGFEMGTNASLQAKSSTPTGTYAFSYDATNKQFKITNGETFLFKDFDVEAASSTGKAYIEFENGLNITLGKELTNTFDPEISINQMVFEVGSSGEVSYDFQVTNVSGDDLGIKMNSVTSESLNIAGLSINSKDHARTAQGLIDNAIDSLNFSLSGIGALQSSFDSVSINLQTQIESTKMARTSFYDVDMAAEITNFSRTQTMTQAATSMLSQANQLPRTLLRLF